MGLPAFSAPMVLLLAPLRALPQRLPAPWAGYTSTSAASGISLSRSEWYICLASSSRLAVRLPAFSRRSGRPTSPMKSVSPVNTATSLPSRLSTMLSESGEWPGVFRARKVSLPTVNCLALVECLVGIIGPEQLAHADNGPGGLGDFQVRRHEVGVGVGFDDGHDFGLVGLGVVVVLLRVAGRVDEHDFAGALAEDGVGEVGQALVFKLFDFHGRQRKNG